MFSFPELCKSEMTSGITLCAAAAATAGTALAMVATPNPFRKARRLGVRGWPALDEGSDSACLADSCSCSSKSRGPLFTLYTPPKVDNFEPCANAALDAFLTTLLCHRKF
jgi:hypothetical protein